MKLGKHLSATESKSSHQKQIADRTNLIRDTANRLGISSIQIETSSLLRDTFRVQFDDRTGRKQTLFLPLASAPTRIRETLRFVSGSRSMAI